MSNVNASCFFNPIQSHDSEVQNCNVSGSASFMNKSVKTAEEGELSISLKLKNGEYYIETPGCEDVPLDRNNEKHMKLYLFELYSDHREELAKKKAKEKNTTETVTDNPKYKQPEKPVSINQLSTRSRKRSCSEVDGIQNPSITKKYQSVPELQRTPYKDIQSNSSAVLNDLRVNKLQKVYDENQSELDHEKEGFHSLP